MYQNRLGPSGGIYYPNFVPCFVVLYLNQIILTHCILKDVFDYNIWIKWIRINQFSPNEFISLLQTHCSFFIAIECTTHDFLDNFGINSRSISNNELLIMIIFCLELTKFGIMPNPSVYLFMPFLSKGHKYFWTDSNNFGLDQKWLFSIEFWIHVQIFLEEMSKAFWTNPKQSANVQYDFRTRY